MLKKLKSDYLHGKLPKPDYIEKMHEVHSALFEYADFIKGTDIAAIEITDGSVVMTTRERGIKIHIDMTDMRIAPIEILNFSVYEKQELDIIDKLIDNGSVVLDIGANIGWYTINFAMMGKNLSVHAFEPIPKTFNYLRRNIELNAIKDVTIYNLGLSNKTEKLTFYYYPTGSGNASAANLSGRDDIEKIQADVIRLDDFICENDITVDFIKCDVEGAELFVFQGAVQTLTSQKPIIFAEMLRKWASKFNYHPNAIISMLREINYQCFVIRDGRLVPFEYMDDNTIETNYLFLHADKHSAKIKSLSQ